MDAARRKALALVVARVVASRLYQAVIDAGVLTEADWDHLRRNVPEDLSASRLAFAEALVEEHYARGGLSLFLNRLLRLNDDVDIYVELSAFKADVAVNEEAMQAALARRANFLAFQELAVFCKQVSPRVCLVYAQRPGKDAKLGTGILIGPDLILTTYHTLTMHIANGQQRDEPDVQLWAVFDHLDGDPIQEIEDVSNDVALVRFHEHWLVDASPDYPPDGTFLKPTPVQEQELATHLDYVVARLSEPAGEGTHRFLGGAVRGWLHLERDVEPTVRDDDRIIIPQHPSGDPQQIDFGRHSQAQTAFDSSNTRIRYSTESARGTSGAPCFNQGFKLVGLHNAAFMPDGPPARCNQAVRITLIRNQARARVPFVDLTRPTVRLWNVSEDRTAPKPIVGRGKLLSWLRDASKSGLLPKNDRAFVALGEGTRVGRSFSAQIVRAHAQGTSDVVVCLGEQDQIPKAADDFLISIGNQLRIDVAALNRLPARPARDAALPLAPGDVEASDPDKLNKWLSDDLPRWFGEIIAAHYGTRDKVAAARRARDELVNAGIAVPRELAELAAALSPQVSAPIDNRVWVVLDNLHREALSEEVELLLAGLLGLNADDGLLAIGLQRLRWIFLGDAPECLVPASPIVEQLDPGALSADDLFDTLRALCSAIALDTQQALSVVEASTHTIWSQSGIDELGVDQRLPRIQSAASDFAGRLYRTRERLRGQSN